MTAAAAPFATPPVDPAAAPRVLLPSASRITGDVDELRHAVDAIAALLGRVDWWDDVLLLEAIAAEIDELLEPGVPSVADVDGCWFWQEVAALHGLT